MTDEDTLEAWYEQYKAIKSHLKFWEIHCLRIKKIPPSSWQDEKVPEKPTK